MYFEYFEWNDKGTISLVYVYYLSVLLLSVGVNSVQMVSDARASDDRQPYGTVLYNSVGRCFDVEDPRMIGAKRIFQDLMPYSKIRFDPLSNEVVQSFLLYFTSVGRIVDKLITKNNIVVAAWYDTVGNYLNSYLLPVTKYCFYSGNVSYFSVKNVQDYHKTVKLRLDTDGYGWSRPYLNASEFQLYIQELSVYQNYKTCSDLMFNSSEDIPLPSIEYDDESQVVISLWVPLKSRQVYDPRTRTSLSVLRIYVETILHCIPKGNRSSQFAARFVQWIDANLTKCLTDTTFYPGFESILRIRKTLELSKKVQGTRKKYFSGSQRESRSGFKFLLDSSLQSDETSVIANDEEDVTTEDERRWMRIKILAATILFALFFLVLCIVISVKLRINQKAMKRKAAFRNEYFKTNRGKLFKPKNDPSDEEVLLMMEKRPNASDTSETEWRHVKQSRKLSTRKQQTSEEYTHPLTETEEDECIQFQETESTTEKKPLIPKNNAKKRDTSCMNCVRKPKPNREFDDSRNSSAYILANKRAS